MKIVLTPIVSNKTTEVYLEGLVLTLDGIDYDLSIIPEGGQAEAEESSPFIGILTRDEVTIKYRYDSRKADPEQSTNWGDYTFEIEKGEVPCPIKWLPEPQEEYLFEGDTNDV